jgi:hypothetical protein
VAFTEDEFWYHLGEIVDLRRNGELTNDQAKWHLGNLMTSGPGVSVVQSFGSVEAGTTVIGFKADTI